MSKCPYIHQHFASTNTCCILLSIVFLHYRHSNIITLYYIIHYYAIHMFTLLFICDLHVYFDVIYHIQYMILSIFFITTLFFNTYSYCLIFSSLYNSFLSNKSILYTYNSVICELIVVVIVMRVAINNVIHPQNKINIYKIVLYIYYKINKLRIIQLFYQS